MHPSTRNSNHPIPEAPSHPGAPSVPRDRYQELMCLVANRAGAGARRSCLCACSCSGNSGPAKSCQNSRRPGPSPRRGSPGAAQPAQPPSAQLDERAKGLWLLGAAEHNRTGGVSADRVLLQSRVTARVCSSLWFGLREGSGGPRGFRSETFADSQATLSSPRVHPEAGLGASRQHHRVRASGGAGQAAKLGSPVARAPVGKAEGGCGVTGAGLKWVPGRSAGKTGLLFPVGLLGRVPRKLGLR